MGFYFYRIESWYGDMDRITKANRRLKIECIILALLIITLLSWTGNKLLRTTTDYIWQSRFEVKEEVALEKIGAVRKGIITVSTIIGILGTLMCLLLYYRQKSRYELKSALKKYEDLIENTKDLIYIHDMRGNFTFFSKSCEELTGFKREDFLGKHFSSVLALESRDIARHVFEEQLKGKDAELFEIVFFDKV